MKVQSQTFWVMLCCVMASMFLAGCPETRIVAQVQGAPQAIYLYGEGTAMSTVTVSNGGSFSMDAVYVRHSDFSEGEIADEVRFTYPDSVFEPIANQPFATTNFSETITIPVMVKSTASSGTYTITPVLYSDGVSIGDESYGGALSVIVNIPSPSSVARITMKPENFGPNSMGEGELIYSSPATQALTWFSTGAGLVPDPGTDEVVGIGETGFTFDTVTFGTPVFGSVTWAANSNALMVRYEMLIHPNSAVFMGSDSWSGNLTGDNTGTATLSLTPSREETVAFSGLHWTSNVSVDVVIDTSNQPMMSWTEETDYPFAEANGNLNYRISIDGVAGGQLQVTVEERDGNNVVETFTGVLSAN